jgi:hypothetical protein
VLSPLLSNIYLHEFDQYVTGTLIPAHKRGDKRRTNPEYQWVCNRLHAIKGKNGFAGEAKSLKKTQCLLSSKDPYDPGYRRLWYVRYADDFVRHEARYVHGARAPTADRRAVSPSP